MTPVTSTPAASLRVDSSCSPAAAARYGALTDGSPLRVGLTSRRTPVSRSLFTDEDPARSRLARPLFDPPRAPASPRPSRRFFDSSSLPDSDSDELKDPDSPRFFDSPRLYYSRKFQCEFLVSPATERARYDSISPSGAVVTSESSGSGARGPLPFSLSPLRLALARTAGRRGNEEPDAPPTLQPSSLGSASAPAPAPDTFVLRPSSGPAPGETVEDFILFRMFDLYEEYENLAVECQDLKRHCQICDDQSWIAMAWSILADRLKVCQIVRKEIQAAGGSVESIPYDLLFGEETL